VENIGKVATAHKIKLYLDADTEPYEPHHLARMPEKLAPGERAMFFKTGVELQPVKVPYRLTLKWKDGDGTPRMITMPYRDEHDQECSG
jgi:hypothetical protein